MATNVPMAAEPIQRPRVVRFLWYSVGGSLPEAHHTWVLHDTSCRTWWVRHFARTMLIIVPLLTAYLVFIPSSLSIRLLTGLTFSGGLLLFSIVNILVDTDRRAVRAGYPSGLVANLRTERSVGRQRLASYERRERIAQRRARGGRR